MVLHARLLAKRQNAAQAWRSDFHCMSRGVCGVFKSFYPHQKREAQTVGLSFSFFVLIGVHGSSRAFCLQNAGTPHRCFGTYRRMIRGVCGEFKFFSPHQKEKVA